MFLYVPWYMFVLLGIVFLTIYFNAGTAMFSAMNADCKKYPKTNMFFDFSPKKEGENNVDGFLYIPVLIFWPALLSAFLIIWVVILVSKGLKIVLSAIFKFIFCGGMLSQ